MKASLLATIVFVGLAGVFTERAAGYPYHDFETKFRSEVIDDQIRIGYGIAIADVQGDGLPDIVLVDAREVVWYENKNPGWEKHVITGALTERDHVCVAAHDIDGDGKAEIAVGAGWNPGDTENSGAVFYLVPGEDRTQPWKPVALPHEPTVHRMHWVRQIDDTYYLAVLPLHGRGNRNGVGEGVKMTAHWPPENPEDEWKSAVISDDYHLTHNFDLTGWNGDTEYDILLAAREGTFILERDGMEWSSTIVTTNAAGEVRSGRLPSGKRFIATIEPMHGNELVVNTHTMTLLGRLFWTGNRVLLDDRLVQGHALDTGDVLGLGYDQIVAGWRGAGVLSEGAMTGIRIYGPLDKRGHEWKELGTVDLGGIACEDLKIADLNGDGKLEIIAAGRATRNVVIYWNETEVPKPEE